MGSKRDRWRETAPTIDDPACAELAARFMAGDIETRENRGNRYWYDGKRDGEMTDGRKYRTRRTRHGAAVHKRGGRY